MSNIVNASKNSRSKGRPRCFDREKALTQALDVFWQRGYEPASIAELCRAMGINAPSLYAAFGNKASLFLEAMRFYEAKYWKAPSKKLVAGADIYQSFDEFFREAARILLSPDSPCGCMVVLAATNVSTDAAEVTKSIRELRFVTKGLFAERLMRGIDEGQLPADTDVPALAGAFSTMLEGLSMQARDGLSQAALERIAAHAVRLLPGWENGLK
jgi:AcrR family transcriptional regulator